MAAKPSAVLMGGKAALPIVYPDALIQQIGEHVDWVTPEGPIHLEAENRGRNSFKIPSSVETIFSTWGMPRLDEQLLDQLPNLKAVFYAAGSVRSFVTDASWRRGVRVFSAARINAIPVAEFTVARIILGLKHAERLRVRSSPDWTAASYLKQSMRGNFRSRVGLVSFGSIARLVQERLSTHDHDVWVYDPFLSESEADKAGVRLTGLEELFRECHAVSLHAPHLAETEGLIRGEHFSSMREGAIFINTARGAVVRQAELEEVMRQRPDLTAYLDVLEEEPPSQNDPLFDLPNVHVTPHIAGSMGHECERMAVAIFDAFRNIQSGGRSDLEVVEADMGRIA